MPNILDNLAADLYTSADMIGREVVGFIPASTVNSGTQTAAVGQSVRSHATRQATAVDSSPSMTIPEGTDQTVDNKELLLTRERAVHIPWEGEETAFVDSGAGYTTVYGDQLTQAMRTLTNEIEVDLAVEATNNASRALGAAGVAPFTADFNSLALGRKILTDNGMPVSDGRNSAVINTLAGANMRQLVQLQRVDNAGDSRLLRQGVLGDITGFMIRESAGIQDHVVGTGAGFLVNNAGGYPAGTSEITVDGGGGTILPGDTITFAGDANVYVVNTFAANVITIGTPGLMLDIADNTAITLGGAGYSGNILMNQGALELAMRAPNVPLGGDAAEDVMTVQDPRSGLVFQVAVYKGYKKAMISVEAVWGVKAWNPDAIATLMG